MQDFKDKAQKNLTDRIKSYGGTPGRAAGGSTHSDAKQDRALVKSMVEPSALKRAAGGHVKAPKKPQTSVNIVIAPKGADNAPIGAGSAAPLVPPRLAPRPAPVPAPAPTPDGPMPAGPMGAKRGGAIKRAAGGKVGMTAGAASGEGRIEKIDAYGAKAGVRKSK